MEERLKFVSLGHFLHPPISVRKYLATNVAS